MIIIIIINYQEYIMKKRVSYFHTVYQKFFPLNNLQSTKLIMYSCYYIHLVGLWNYPINYVYTHSQIINTIHDQIGEHLIVLACTYIV